MRVAVLRLGHRKDRDKRVTTHVCLAARALGADFAIISGERDDRVIKSVAGVSQRFGGRFFARHEPNYRKAVARLKKGGYSIVHLTMYGEPLEKMIGAVRRKRKVCVIVGAGKVPRDVYEMADYNISVTGQPHSEFAAIAIFLHELFFGKELSKKFPNARLRVVPQARGKKVMARGKKG